ncbi:hypothetical protein HYZ99_02890 [Candidatus Peregrinibacteria bacterium]|nr:hypothetical protein [Candidatus Peregrinibacteria bacterium]
MPSRIPKTVRFTEDAAHNRVQTDRIAGAFGALSPLERERVLVISSQVEGTRIKLCFSLAPFDTPDRPNFELGVQEHPIHKRVNIQEILHELRKGLDGLEMPEES